MENITGGMAPCSKDERRTNTDTEHHFNKQEQDWGITSIIPFRKLYDPSSGYLVKDTLVVEVKVTCYVDEKEREDLYTYIKVF
ncbi:hypothetical protein TSUD_252910 [Trifolium subterraneum]|nr:hypothetical protein TSUD_252910 [Trifolium subterraneum]